MLTRYKPRRTVSWLLGLTFQFKCPFKMLLLSKFPECEALAKIERLMSKMWSVCVFFLYSFEVLQRSSGLLYRGSF